MSKEMVSVKDFAAKYGLLKQTVFKVLKRLDIEPVKSLGDKQNRGQTVAYISEDEASRVLEALATGRNFSKQANSGETELVDASLYDAGVFYLLCLEPEHDPNRFKVGFATNLNERLRQHRCSAPFIEVVKTWPCRRLWEKTAIECVTNGCEKLHTEIFRAHSLEIVQARCEQFFALMPTLDIRE